MAKSFVQTEMFTELNHPRPKVDFSKSPTKTHQEFKVEADVNNLLKRYNQTGYFYDPLTLAGKNRRQPFFGDFTVFKDFQTAQNIVIEARMAFESLPAEVRKRFRNNPEELITWLQDDSNRDEAIKLGLIENAAEAATPEPAKDAQAAATKPASETTGASTGASTGAAEK